VREKLERECGEEKLGEGQRLNIAEGYFNRFFSVFDNISNVAFADATL